jgi:hypothetical protein
MQGQIMKEDQITPSVLHIVANENIDISADLTAQQNHTLSELLKEPIDEEKENNQKEKSQD